MLAEYGMPAPVQWGDPRVYLQMMPRHQLVEQRRKNDIVFLPIGCTENHGMHLPSATDTLFVSQILEGVRRYIDQTGWRPPGHFLPPLNFGAHPYHHMGMPGTAIVREDIAREMLIDVMLGLWNDGFRKIIMINNHGHLWMLEASIQQFQKRYHLPGIFRVLDWHRGVREMFREKKFGGEYDSTFVHAAEAETSLALYLFPEMVDMEYAVNTSGKATFPMVTLTNQLTPIAVPAAGPKAKATLPLKFPPPRKVLLGWPPTAKPAKPKNRWRPF
jgi:creatinine amidohydrolase/Fe(II)-dependent formamide hydrolase-like protein